MSKLMGVQDLVGYRHEPANVFRVFVTSLLAYTVTEEVTREPLHSIMGLSVFVVAFVMMFIVGQILKRVFR